MSDFLSFNFDDVSINTGATIADLPLGVPLYATIESVESGTFSGETKFIILQNVYTENDEIVPVKTFIGSRMGWLLAQYLDAVGEDFRSLSGQAITAQSLNALFKEQTIQVVMRESNYTDRQTGEARTSKQVGKVLKFGNA